MRLQLTCWWHCCACMESIWEEEAADQTLMFQNHFQLTPSPLTSSVTLLVSVPASLVTEQVYTPASLSARLLISSCELSLVLVTLLHALSKEKQTSILLPADLWSRDASEGAHQFKVISLSVSRWCWQVHYGRSSCVGEIYTYGCCV